MLNLPNFFRFKHIEAYGTGIRRIYKLYADSNVEPEIAVTENTFRIILPNMNYHHENKNNYLIVHENRNLMAPKTTAQMQEILDYLSEYGSMTEDEVMELLAVQKTRAYLITRQMAELGLIEILGRGKDKKYVKSRNKT